VLDEIVARKRVDLEARKRDAPIEALRARAAPGNRLFRRALSAPGARFVLEMKRASPSRGALRADLDPAAAARAYEGAADAISVVTDGPFFGGSLGLLRAVRAQTALPLLCKDFIVEPYQVVEARAHGADAVLLMMSVLDDAGAAACLAEVDALGIDALVEVHSEEELRRALALPAPILGINNRDLCTLSVDLAVTERLAQEVPMDRLLVSESGIRDRADVARLAPRVDGFLVGSSLMEQADLFGAARALVLGRVKICGLTRRADVLAAARLGAAWGGLIFAEGSPRRLSVDRAAAIAGGTPLPLVGVFRDAPISEMAQAAEALGLAAVQLHGDEPAAAIGALRAALDPRVEIWKAMPVDTEGAAGAVAGDGPPEADRGTRERGVPTSVDRLVFDSRHAGRIGGTGRAFDWERLRDHPRWREALLAGGIGPENAVRARAAGTFAMDVSSGVEERPGIKSEAAMEALFAALRGPSRRGSVGVARLDGRSA
jgi:indole-3-glycerol phosphate synthase/phosphoribosylanthranilate isomerase